MADSSHENDFSKTLFVAVHAGAGFHSEEKSAEYKDLCKKACLQAMCLLKKKKPAPEAVTAAVSVLEDSDLSNAGRGSNLTITGCVECDASVMEGCSCMFGAMGCVSGVVNPVQVACRLLQFQQNCSLSLGRVPPSVLVGTGATDWAKQQGFSCEDHQKLITGNSNRMYKKYMRKLERAERLSTAKKARCTDDNGAFATSESQCTHGSSPDLLNFSTSLTSTPGETCSHRDRTISSLRTDSKTSEVTLSSDDGGLDLDKDHRECDAVGEQKGGRDGMVDDLHENPAQDTVGAVCVDWEGNVSAAVSSGGIWLKTPGRLGPAAMYGAGCWAQNAGKGVPGVAVVTSGCGEHVMRTSLAKTCADCLVNAEDATEGLHTCFSQHFLESRLLSGVCSRLAGAVAVRITHTQHSVPDVEVCWGHTTDSMALGYLRGDGQKPKTLISRLSEGCRAGSSFTMSSAVFSH
ncbi:threonine aspartase 1-like [Babylonia areolata]|uniref:threonine aspartase 1-like n=1 Tax=Babylonia areolata TaxID=304850 RepID=UPI003FD59450